MKLQGNKTQIHMHTVTVVTVNYILVGFYVQAKSIQDMTWYSLLERVWQKSKGLRAAYSPETRPINHDEFPAARMPE